MGIETSRMRLIFGKPRINAGLLSIVLARDSLIDSATNIFALLPFFFDIATNDDVIFNPRGGSAGFHFLKFESAMSQASLIEILHDQLDHLFVFLKKELQWRNAGSHIDRELLFLAT